MMLPYQADNLVTDATIHFVKTFQCDKEIFCETMSRSSTKVATFTIHKIIPDGVAWPQ